jgi:hypothetical protein
MRSVFRRSVASSYSPELRCNLFHATLLIAWLGTAWPANADIILFSNFGPGDSFTTSQGVTVSGSPTFFLADANQFIPTITAGVERIDVALFVFGPSDSVILQLRADNLGRPGTVLESYTLADLPFVPAKVVSANSTLRTTLFAGTPYWIAVVPGSETTLGGWNDSLGSNGLSIQSGDPDFITGFVGEFSTGQSAYRVVGVPEPGSLSLAGSATITLLCLWRSRRARGKTESTTYVQSE